MALDESATQPATMTDSERDQFLARPLIAVAGTSSPDGECHLSPIWYRWDGQEFLIAIGDGGTKLRNLRRDRRISLCFDKRDWPYASVIAACSADILDAVKGYPAELAQRYLEGDLMESFLQREQEAGSVWYRVALRPYRWYGHINRGG